MRAWAGGGAHSGLMRASEARVTGEGAHGEQSGPLWTCIHLGERVALVPPISPTHKVVTNGLQLFQLMNGRLVERNGWNIRVETKIGDGGAGENVSEHLVHLSSQGRVSWR